MVVACGVDQTDPAGTGNAAQAPAGGNTSPYSAPNSAQGALYLDVLAVASSVTATLGSPTSRTIDMTPAGPVPSTNPVGSMAVYSSHFTDVTTDGGRFLRYSLTANDDWVDSGVALLPSAPTRVELSGLSAETGRTGVQVEWQTGFEAENLGYRVYREVNGAKVPVSNGLIAGSALSFRTAHLQAGYSYAWNDPHGSPGDRYWLESVDLSGRHQWHGPVEVARGKFQPQLKANSALITALGADVAVGSRPRGRFVRQVCVFCLSGVRTGTFRPRLPPVRRPRSSSRTAGTV